jgi:hypothetical protein
MKKENIMIPFESEQLAALDFSLKKKNTSVQAQMEKTLQELYEAEVPEPLREYLDSKTAPAPKLKRTVKSAALKPQSNEPKSDLMKEDN